MSQTERIYRIQQMLQERDIVPREVFLQEFEISLATFKRDLDFLRDRFEVDVIWDRGRGGYCLRGDPSRTQLPGPMYSAREINALLLIDVAGSRHPFRVFPNQPILHPVAIRFHLNGPRLSALPVCDKQV